MLLTAISSRQGCRVVKSTVIVIDRSRFKTYSRHSVVPLEKTLYSAFLYLAILASSSKFNHVFIKELKFEIKSSVDINILASPEAGRSNCFRNVQGVAALNSD